VSQTGRSRRGFTLTEILMAVGILGIGLTMVASVFPVAVDQSRRSREITMAALCARSVAATIRAKRELIVYSTAGSGGIRQSTIDPISKVSKTVDLGFSSQAFRVYNPDSFLYEQDRSYKTSDGATDVTSTWLAGNYYPVVLATPVFGSGTVPGRSGLGPWRLTIIVYKSNGIWPDNVNATNTTTYMKSWNDTRITYHAQPGSYIVNWTPSNTSVDNFRGEAYLIDNVAINTTNSNGTSVVDWAGGAVWLAATPTSGSSQMQAAAGGNIAITTSNGGSPAIPMWVGMPQSIAAFHTVIGD
jgi:prepilin-type N-terminal cleavage/methylation domain-containing protein